MKALYLRNACCCVAQTRSGIDRTYRTFWRNRRKSRYTSRPKEDVLSVWAVHIYVAMWVSCPTRVAVMPCAARCRRIALLAKQCSHS